jgi:hypothetical protein
MRCRHLTLNGLYDVRGDAATGASTTVVTLATAGGYQILGQGAYEDRLVREGGQWRIAYRGVRTDRLVSDPDKPINLADPDVAALVAHLTEAARRLGKKVGSRGWVLVATTRRTTPWRTAAAWKWGLPEQTLAAPEEVAS